VVNGFVDGFVAVDGFDAVAGIDTISGVVFLTVFLAVALLGTNVGIGSGLPACCWQCHVFGFFAFQSTHGGRYMV
jgi:hypothetical protein